MASVIENITDKITEDSLFAIGFNIVEGRLTLMVWSGENPLYIHWWGGANGEVFYLTNGGKGGIVWITLYTIDDVKQFIETVNKRK